MNENIETIKRKMLVKYPFFGSVVANVDYKETREMDTAGTDGQTIYYNPYFLKKLKSDEQIFIFAHEVCHIAFDHIRRSEGKDPDIWNTATDAVINQFLKRDGLKIVGNGVDIAEAINYDAEQLYDKLLQQKKQNQEQDEQDNQQHQENSSSSEQKQQGQGQSSETQSQEQSNSEQKEQDSSSKQNQNSSKDSQSQNENKSKGNSSSDSSEENHRDVGHDTHSLWKDALKTLKDKLSKNKKESLSDKEQTEEQMQKQKEQGSPSSKQNQNKNQSKENSSDSSEEKNHDVGHDTHSLWKDAVKRQKEKESEAKQESNKHQTEEQKQKQKEEDLEQEIVYISTMGEKRAFNKNLEEKKKELEALKQVLIEQVMEAGTSTNREQRIINDIGKSKPIIDWRYVLREAIQFDVDWSYKNAYIEDGVVSANLEEQPRPETEIVLDTSGSIDELLLKNFLRECKNILQHSKVKVGCFDTEFYGFHEIRTEEDIENMKFEGGGGTDFNVAVRAFTRRVENKIIFTDGWANMPDIPMDVIWIVFGVRKIHPKGGKVIQINKEQLDKLYSLNHDMLYQRKK